MERAIKTAIVLTMAAMELLRKIKLNREAKVVGMQTIEITYCAFLITSNTASFAQRDHVFQNFCCLVSSSC